MLLRASGRGHGPPDKAKRASFRIPVEFGASTDLVELQRQRALLVGRVVLVQQTLGSSRIDRLDCDFVSALGLGAIAFNGSSLELLDSSLQCGLIGFVASISRLCHQNTLLSRLDIRQTKHLPDIRFFRVKNKTSTQDDILASLVRKCKTFLQFWLRFSHKSISGGHATCKPQHFVFRKERPPQK